MNVGIPKETAPLERRVAASPDTIQRLRKLGLDVLVQTGAGIESGFPDEVFIQAGARVVLDARALFAEADLVLKVRPPTLAEVDLMKPGAALVGFFWPAQNKALIERLAARKATVLAMDAVPRITRAQRMDALSAMANIAGYRAVLEAANHFDRFIPGQITAAGRAKPHSAHDHSSPARVRSAPQAGQADASSCQCAPPATHVMSRAAPAAHATSGSSALATTRTSGCAVSASCQRTASMRVSE